MKDELKQIPGVDKLLSLQEIKNLISEAGDELVKYAIRIVLQTEREKVLAGDKFCGVSELVKKILATADSINQPSLLPVINATGVVLHTNLARAPLGEWVGQQLLPLISGYSNLEFDLKTGKRGQRNSHTSELIKFITRAEDTVIVNNNAAAVMLCLKVFASGGEVIVSRGELIEIGGSFRIPDIMKASGAKMVEVGTTNRTRLADYENAITDRTRIIFKAHKSNYFIGGFTEEVEIGDLVALAKKHNLIFYYDMGSGLLKKPKTIPLENEPDVRSVLQDEVDIVSFSGDKLFGGPQAGIIAGKEKFIKKIARDPMMRALRVGKITIAALHAVGKCYLNESELISRIPIFSLLNRSISDKLNLAVDLSEKLKNFGIENEVIDSISFAGGGSLPHLTISSKAVKLISKNRSFAKKTFDRLLQLKRPILGVLREGDLLFDVQSVFEKDLDYIAQIVAETAKANIMDK
jgi:L-seryl-tRNA(Ser) seleniumtransferase